MTCDDREGVGEHRHAVSNASAHRACDLATSADLSKDAAEMSNVSTQFFSNAIGTGTVAASGLSASNFASAAGFDCFAGGSPAGAAAAEVFSGRRTICVLATRAEPECAEPEDAFAEAGTFAVALSNTEDDGGRGGGCGALLAALTFLFSSSSRAFFRASSAAALAFLSASSYRAFFRAAPARSRASARSIPCHCFMLSVRSLKVSVDSFRSSCKCAISAAASASEKLCSSLTCWRMRFMTFSGPM